MLSGASGDVLVAPVGSVAPEAPVASVGPVKSVKKGFVLISWYIYVLSRRVF